MEKVFWYILGMFTGWILVFVVTTFGSVILSVLATAGIFVIPVLGLVGIGFMIWYFCFRKQ